MSKKKALLVMAATKNYLFSVANVLIGLQKHCPGMFDDVVIFTEDNVPASDHEALCKIRPVSLRPYHFQLDNQNDRVRLAQYTNMTYARYEMLTFLDRYEKVFWLDTDVLVTGDLTPLLDYAKTGLSMSDDLVPAPAGHSIQAFFNKPIEGYDMSAPAYATGVIIISDKLPQPAKLHQYLYDQMNRYSSDVTYADQGILHLMIQDFGIEVDVFDKLTYHAFSFEDKSKARLIHLLGPTKPWCSYNAFAYDEWYENHMHWRALGGSEVPFFEELGRRWPAAFYGPRRYQNLMELHHYSQMLSAASPAPAPAPDQPPDPAPSPVPAPAQAPALMEVADKGVLRWQYYRCKILSKITWGKKRAHYKRKRDALHEQVRQLRRFLKS